MSTDPFTGRNPSYCFVELGTPEEANRAMGELNGRAVMGRPVKINVNTPKRDKDRSEGARPPILSYDRGWRPQISNQDPKQEGGNPYVFDRWQRKDAAEHFKGPTEENRRLYVGGLPRIPNQDTVNDEMRALFKDYKM
jgi:RNA recognition motif-containing protein